MLSRGGALNEPRNVAIYLVRFPKRREWEIERQFGVGKYRSASSAIEKMKREISEDRKLRSSVKEIEEMLTNSQQQTSPLYFILSLICAHLTSHFRHLNGLESGL